MPEIALLLLVAGVLLTLSIVSSKLSERLGVPTLLMFLGIGMIAGSEGPGGIPFDNAVVASSVGSVALAYILFAGGLDTHWQSIRPVLARGAALSTVGVLVTAGLLGLFTWQVLGAPWQDALLLAAIVSSTDAAAVFSILRSRRVSLKGELRPLLELESGSNDPMAIFLTLGLLEIYSAQASIGALIGDFALQAMVGTAGGLLLGRGAAWMFNRIRLDYDGLYPVLSLAVVMLTFGLSEFLGGNGFLAVYLCGIVLGNSNFLYKRSLTRFHDGLSWLMQIALFLVLGLLVFPSHLLSVVWTGLAVSAFLMFVARPVAVYLGLLGSQFTYRERTLVAWTGLRGAVPIVLATFPLLAGYPESELIFNVVFFVVLTSVLLQGKSLMLVARWLGVDKPLENQTRYPLEFDRTGNMEGETREFTVPAGGAAAGKKISELGLPPDVLILLIRRGTRFLVPRGSTRLEPRDTLMVLAELPSLRTAQEVIEAGALARSEPTAAL